MDCFARTGADQPYRSARQPRGTVYKLCSFFFFITQAFRLLYRLHVDDCHAKVLKFFIHFTDRHNRDPPRGARLL